MRPAIPRRRKRGEVKESAVHTGGMAGRGGKQGGADADVAVVGAGFAGLYLAHRATTLGLTVVVLEAGESVGGTWYWNRYPGARCDVESIDYSYSFSEELQQEWRWTERYASQPEILRYLNHVADRFDLRRHIRLNTRVTAARFDEDALTWTLTTDTDETVTAAFCVMATGGLSVPNRPDLPGLDDFRGEWYHTARWPAGGVDLRGRRVAVVGTGSTGIQAIPMIAREADHLIVLQRTPNFSVPARNRPLSEAELAKVKATYARRRARGRIAPSGVPSDREPSPGRGVPPERRRQAYEAGWAEGGASPLLRAYSDMLVDEEVNASLADFVRDKIGEIVDDPATAAALTPYGYPLGAKRLCLDTDYFATYNRPNVELVDLRKTPIERITETGIQTGDTLYETDVIVFATGFDAISGAVTAIDVRGRADRSLRDYWRTGPRATLGLMAAGFPNLFLVNGPGSPAVLGNVLAFIEHHVEWIIDCIDSLRRDGIHTIESSEDSDERWAVQVDEIAAATLYPKAESWFAGANVPGKPRRFLPYAAGLHTYRARCDDSAARGYGADFVLDHALSKHAEKRP
ncbi:Phenylacetone monooxygenase [Frankia canadensis]|uniref:Phenylacetone monooxygenase n=1 Tax=Frankia canadensis TaxID=1836972 RepID=A0A2I2KLT4_9ACTN|nr:Phenylacetone monooxygenase [Frankia canadensis]SOU53917.1 Phenylacetone monooxygenase [Frankia canadensis]